MSKIAQVLFTRAPIPGKTKRRLTPFLTPQQAADLHKGMIRDTMSAMKAVRADIFICYEPAAGAKVFFEELVGKNRIYPQRGRSIHRRVMNCFIDLHKQGYGAIYAVVSDSPSVRSRYLQEAMRAISQSRPVLVVGPSQDRGVYLLGTNQFEDLRFLEHIPWGERATLDLLVKQVQPGLGMKFLPKVKDIDERQDVYWLLKESERAPQKELKHVRSFFRACGRDFCVNISH